MALNLDTLPAVKLGVKMEQGTRGRAAAPVPQPILDAVKATYALPAGEGATISLPNGTVNDKGNDPNVSQLTGLLRRAAKTHGYGISISVGERGAKTTPVTFRAKDFTARPRKPKTDDAELVYILTDEDNRVALAVKDFEDDTYGVCDGDEEGARLATRDEAVALGYVEGADGVWTLAAEDDAAAE